MFKYRIYLTYISNLLSGARITNWNTEAECALF